MGARLPPGPNGLPLIGVVRAIDRDPLGLPARWVRTYGDVVSFRLFRLPVFLLGHPDLVESVLVTDHRKFRKSRDYQGLAAVLGHGLLTSEGSAWLHQRRLAQPAFHHDRIAAYGHLMTDVAERRLGRWRAGETRDVHQEMMALTLEIVAGALFGAGIASEAGEFGAAIRTILAGMTIGRMFLPALLRVPTPANLRFRRAIRRLDEIVYRLIDARRRSTTRGRDLLSTLLDARDEQGHGMTDRELRDEILTLLVAGHETTALALTWTSYLITRHPDVQQRLRTELAEVLGDRPATVDDIPRLSYTRAVLLESMRLYPPAWSIGREAIEPCEIGGYAVPAGAQIWISQWILHRDPRFFSEAEQFRPERWESGRLDRLPRFAYFPFGGGPRHCIGQSFAMLEATLLLAAIARRFELVREPNPPVGLWPVMTLRPKEPIRITLRAR